jgi:hypothetical protein
VRGRRDRSPGPGSPGSSIRSGVRPSAMQRRDVPILLLIGVGGLVALLVVMLVYFTAGII